MTRNLKRSSWRKSIKGKQVKTSLAIRRDDVALIIDVLGYNALSGKKVRV